MPRYGSAYSANTLCKFVCSKNFDKETEGKGTNGCSDVSPVMQLPFHLRDLTLRSTVTQVANTLLSLQIKCIQKDLHGINVVEGEAGSGKSALLKRIAGLWASSKCPVLNRFKLVFYLSLNSSNNYGESRMVPDCIDEMMQKNHINKISIIASVRTNKVGKIRHFANAIFAITQFKLSSSLFLLKKLYSHDIHLVQVFGTNIVLIPALQDILKTPLFIFAVCVLWLQYPLADLGSIAHIYRTYLTYSLEKEHQKYTNLPTIILSCGDLALKGVFEARFQFTEEHLREVGLEGEEAVELGLLSKFTAQRLNPVYRFFHKSFQEHMVGKKLIQLMESPVLEETERGLCYLQQINTFPKIMNTFCSFLLNGVTTPSKSAVRIISHLFYVFENSSLNGDQINRTERFQHVLEMEELNEIIRREFVTFNFNDLKIPLLQMFLNFVIELAYLSEAMTTCAPHILNFVTGRRLQFTCSSSSATARWPLLHFLRDHPECLTLIKSVKLVMIGLLVLDPPTSALLKKYVGTHGPPTVESEYASAFQCYTSQSWEAQNQKNKQILTDHYGMLKSHLPENLVSAFTPALEKYKMPLLQLDVEGLGCFDKSDCIHLMMMCSVAESVDLQMQKSPGFLGSIRPVLVTYKDTIKKISVKETKLTLEEQALLASLTMLDSLEVTINGCEQVPDYLLSNLDKFIHLQELSIILPKMLNIFPLIPNTFSNFHAQCIQHFCDLKAFYLKCPTFPAFDKLVEAMSFCKKLEEIKLNDFSLTETGMLSFGHLKVSSLPVRMNPTSLVFLHKLDS
nr:PREDICTED: baculoviral IAP repeat-containing protein 1-like [Latimeria chalumnae]|eukprot:XP_014346598.1 PREDICTED: baculoviral IAP repeat-containing protein 1-like [Latimeria chalumnae]